MAEQPGTTDNLNTLLGALPREQLVQISRKEALEGLQNICRTELGGRIVLNVMAALFPELPRSRLAAATQQIGFNAIRNALLMKIACMPGAYELNIHSPDDENALALHGLEGPAILAFWHFGPVNMLPLGLRRVGVTAQIFTRATPTRWTATEDFARMRLSLHDPKRSVSALRRALQHLKGGGKVAVAIDGSMGKRDIDLPFLGRRFAVSRGAAGLARLTGAPVIPCTMQWEPKGWDMAVRVFRPLPRPSTDDQDAFERELLVSAGQCFEAYAREHPNQFKIDQLKDLIDSPPVNA